MAESYQCRAVMWATQIMPDPLKCKWLDPSQKELCRWFRICDLSFLHSCESLL